MLSFNLNTVRIRLTAFWQWLGPLGRILLVLLFGFVWLLLLYYAPVLRQADAYDKQAMLLLNYGGSAFSDVFWYTYSQKIVWLPLAAVAVYSMLHVQPRGGRNRLWLLLAILLLVVLLDQVSSTLIKQNVCRLRPTHAPDIGHLLHTVNGYRGGRYGFVSGHATNSVGVSVFLALTFRHRLMWVVFFLFAFMMCYSRIYLGVHYPGDILGGACLGTVMSWGAFRILERRKIVTSVSIYSRPILYVYGASVLGILIYAFLKTYST